MIITYFRSSSFNQFNLCQQSYFMNYVLGIPQPSGKRAEIGTIVHKVFECLAKMKQADQNGVHFILDEHFGVVNCPDLFDPMLVSQLVDLSYSYYTDPVRSINKFAPRDKVECHNLVVSVLNEGLFDPRLRNILEAEPFFDFEIKEDWAKYDYGNGIIGYLSMKGTIDLVTMVGDTMCEVIDWKGLPIDTSIPAINGWTTMGKLAIGDIVFDELGQPTSVIGKSQIKQKNCYEIHFDDTTSVIADDEHLWKLDNGTIVNTKNLQIKNKINITQPLITQHTPLPIHPYVLGAWLGDGRNRCGEISGIDQYIFDKIVEHGYSLGNNLNKNRCPSRTVYGLTTKLRQLNLLHNKHIPTQYLRSSYEQRLSLLKGLMDTDGNANICRKQAVFTSASQKLSNDVKELLLSLGQRPNQSFITRTNVRFPQGIVSNKKHNIYPLHFRPININPFDLPRKADQIDPTWGPGKSNKRTITQIKCVGTKHTQCIMVDSPTHTYLCTDNMIPTHNTGQRKDWSNDQVKDFWKLSKDPQLRIYHLALSQMYPDIKHFAITIHWVRDGGPFTLSFGPEDLVDTHNMLRKQFKRIQETTRPKLKSTTGSHWFCKRVCNYGKSQHQSGCTLCQFIKKETVKKGMDYVIDQHTHDGFAVDYYHNPGS